MITLVVAGAWRPVASEEPDQHLRGARTSSVRVHDISDRRTCHDFDQLAFEQQPATDLRREDRISDCRSWARQRPLVRRCEGRRPNDDGVCSSVDQMTASVPMEAG